MAPRRQATSLAGVEQWRHYASEEITQAAQATGFISFELSFRESYSVFPRDFLIFFDGASPSCSSLLKLCIVPEEAVPAEARVGVEVKAQEGDAVLCQGQHVEFELLSRISDVPLQPKLKIAAGPVRQNPETNQREFMRIDVGRSLRVFSDTLDDTQRPKRSLARSRWWICAEVLRLVGVANGLILDGSMEWVICLVDPQADSALQGPNPASTIDELVQFIDGGKKRRGKPRKKKKPEGGSEEKDDILQPSMPDVPGDVDKALAELSSAQSLLDEMRRASSNFEGAVLRVSQPFVWEKHVAVQHTIEATDFLHFNLRTIAGARSVDPEHTVVTSTAEQSLLLTLRVVRDSEIPPGILEGALAAELRSATLPEQLSHLQGQEEESVEFELLSPETNNLIQKPLVLTAGPVRVNTSTGQREFMSVPFSECVRWGPKDAVDDFHGAVTKFYRRRWWVSLDLIRLICALNSVPFSGIDSGMSPPVPWVFCLFGGRAAQAESCASSQPCSILHEAEGPLEVHAEPRDGGQAKAKRSPKTAPQKSDRAVASGQFLHTERHVHSEAEDASRQAPPRTVPSKTLALPAALVDVWCSHVEQDVRHVSEASGFVHFALFLDSSGKRIVSPEHHIIAFPTRGKGRLKYQSSLLTLRVVPDNEVPEDVHVRDPADSEGVEYVECQLLSRVHEVHQPLQITAGPVRSNPETGQRESMRMDLGRCLRQVISDVIQDRGKRLARQRWWICLETIRLVCLANSLDCRSLDGPGLAVEWVLCLLDERAPEPKPEKRDIDDLVDFIDGRKGKRRADPAANARAAAQLLAEAAAACSSPEQAAAAQAAAEAARRFASQARRS